MAIEAMVEGNEKAVPACGVVVAKALLYKTTKDLYSWGVCVCAPTGVKK
jgi:hypothetical protein